MGKISYFGQTEAHVFIVFGIKSEFVAVYTVSKYQCKLLC